MESINKQLKKVYEKYRLQINNAEPIEFKGLTFYPLLMKDIYILENIKGILSVRTKSELAKYPYMTMLFMLDSTKENDGYGVSIEQLMILLCMTLKIDVIVDKNKVDMQIVRDTIKIQSNAKQQIELIINGVTITENIFYKIKQIIALQNKIELIDETENMQLRLEFEKQSKMTNKNNLECDIDYLISGVCVYHHIRRKQLFEDYSIYEFIDGTEAIEQILNHEIYNNGNYGTSKQNPFAHWAYRTPVDCSYGLLSAKDFSENSSYKVDSQMEKNTNINSNGNAIK